MQNAGVDRLTLADADCTPCAIRPRPRQAVTGCDGPRCQLTPNGEISKALSQSCCGLPGAMQLSAVHLGPAVFLQRFPGRARPRLHLSDIEQPLNLSEMLKICKM